MTRGSIIEDLEQRRMLSVDGGGGDPPAADDSTWVTAVYRHVLHRDPDPGGLGGFVAQLGAGATRRQVATSIVDSSEHHGRQVDDLYHNLLGRDPEPAARASATAFLDNSGNERDVVKSITASDEYYARQGGTGGQYVDGLYHDVLGRPADDAGKAGFTSALANGVDRSAVAGVIADSPESIGRRVRDMYQEALHRSGDDAGVSGFSQEIEHGGREETVETELLDSAEFETEARNDT